MKRSVGVSHPMRGTAALNLLGGARPRCATSNKLFEDAVCDSVLGPRFEIDGPRASPLGDALRVE
jgi:hypothetical protein